MFYSKNLKYTSHSLFSWSVVLYVPGIGVELGLVNCTFCWDWLRCHFDISSVSVV